LTHAIKSSIDSFAIQGIESQKLFVNRLKTATVPLTNTDMKNAVCFPFCNHFWHVSNVPYPNWHGTLSKMDSESHAILIDSRCTLYRVHPDMQSRAFERGAVSFFSLRNGRTARPHTTHASQLHLARHWFCFENAKKSVPGITVHHP
jgi:hypothetical protein